MKIDVTFEESGEHIDVIFHNMSKDPNVVKSVNNITPDQDGNVQVTSTCDLEQPRWGKSGYRVLDTIEHDHVNGFIKPMSKEEFDTLLSNVERADLVAKDGSNTIEDVDISAAVHKVTTYPFDSDDPADNVPCFVLDEYWWDHIEYKLVLMGTELAKIPAMYLDIEFPEYPDQPEQPEKTASDIIEGIMVIDTYETIDGSIMETHHFYRVTGISLEGDYSYEEEQLRGETGKIYVALNLNKMYRYPWQFDLEYDDGYGNFVELTASSGGSGDLGDIATALDRIISLQEELIGGGGE